jgi:SAM-dependent methyltransferase
VEAKSVLSKALDRLRPFGSRITKRLPPSLRRRLWPLLSRESVFVHRYLDGLKGIEVGGSAHNDYGVDAINVDRFESMDTIFKQEEWQVCGRKLPIDIVAAGDNLPFPDDAVEFVLASHVIEHFPDPIRTLREWVRVASRYAVVVVPHRDRTFDRDRELTSIDEFLRRGDRAADLSTPPHDHWSVWTLESFMAMCRHFGLRVVDQLDPDDKVGNGFIVVLDASS